MEKRVEGVGRRGGWRGWGSSALAAAKDGDSPGSNLGLLKMVTFLLSGVSQSPPRSQGLYCELGAILS